MTTHLRNGRQPALNLDSLYGDGPTSPAARRPRPRPCTTASRCGCPTVADNRSSPATTSRPTGARPVPRPVAGRRPEHPGRRRGRRRDRGQPQRREPHRRPAARRVRCASTTRCSTASRRPRAGRADRPAGALRPRPPAGALALPVARRPRLPQDRDAAGRGRQGAARRQQGLRTPRRRGVHAAGVLGRRRSGSGTRWCAAVYDYNRNFGRKDGGTGVVRRSPPSSRSSRSPVGPALDGSSAAAPFSGTGLTTLPFNWVIEWDRFVRQGREPARPLRPQDRHAARAAAASTCSTRSGRPGRASRSSSGELLTRLAVRNLLRGYSLALPTGQAVAGGARDHPADAPPSCGRATRRASTTC